ncbi:Beta-lactamase class A [Tsukamurella ocularis]
MCSVACTIGDAGSAAPSSPASSSEAPHGAASTRPGAPDARSSSTAPRPADPLRAALERAIAGIPGQASVAVAGGGRVVIAGNGTGLPAWSTSKVPLVMAALERAGTPQPAVTADMRAAIIRSDNAAAEAIWSSFPTPDQAGAAMQQVLRAGGDERTVVQTTKVRPEYSAFGQTRWEDGPAATFAARLPCSPSGRATAALMREVDANQQWGAYLLPGARSVGVKGGWGPGTDGAYVVRQLAVVQTAGGYTGVMLSARPADGTFASGRVALTRLADAVRAQLGALPAAPC